MAGPLIHDRESNSAGRPGRGWQLVFVEMLRIGLTAFGGGSATTVALRQMVVRRGWLTEAEFLDTVVLSRLTPGISIIAQVLLIGRRVAGLRGMVAGTIGMLLPAVVITIGLTRVYDMVSDSPAAATPLKCLAGAAAGFAVALFLQLLRDTLRSAPRAGGPLVFAVIVAVALLVDNAEIVLAVAIGAGICLPRLFERKDVAREKDAADEP